MNTARLWGLEHSQTISLPDSLAEVGNRANLVQAINEMLAGRYMPTMTEPQKEAFLAEVLTVCDQHIMEDLPDDEKISVGLRVWSGCLAAAKTIAGETRDGPQFT